MPNFRVLITSLCCTRTIMLQAIAYREKLKLQRFLYTWKEECMQARHGELTRSASTDFEGLSKNYQEMSR